MRRRRLVRLAVALAGSTVLCSAATAQSSPEFFAGRTINLLIGFGPGGGNDTWARVIARHIGRHLPGNPNVVPQNVPGAGGLKLANQIYAVSPRDGTTIASVSRGIPLEPLFGGQGTSFDPLKLNWIGSPDRDTAICVARADTGVKSIKDAATRELVMAATGSGTDSAIYPEFLSLLLGLKLKTVRGYKGSNEMHLVIERGEAHGMCGSYESVMQGSNLAREGKLVILFQGRLEPDPRLKGVAYWGDVARSDEEKSVLQLFLTRSALGRPMMAPPGVPPERVELLRRAFDATMKDPKFIEDAERSKLTIEPMTGEELAATLAKAYAAPADVIKRTREIMGRTNATAPAGK